MKNDKYYDDDMDEIGHDDNTYRHNEGKKDIFRSFVRSLGLREADEKRAMSHLENFVKSVRLDDDDDDDVGDGDDKNMVKEKNRVMSYNDGAYDDSDEDILKDRLQQNAQYAKR